MKRKIFGAALALSALLAIFLFRQSRTADSPADTLPSPDTRRVAKTGQATASITASDGHRSGKVDNLSIDRSVIAAVDAETDSDRQGELLERAARSVPQSTRPSILQDLDGKDTPAANSLRQLLVRRWAEEDAPSAAQWVIQHWDNVADKEVVAQVALAWAGSDPQAAATWTTSLPEHAARQQALLNIGYEVA